MKKKCIAVKPQFERVNFGSESTAPAFELSDIWVCYQVLIVTVVIVSSALSYVCFNSTLTVSLKTKPFPSI